MGTPVTVDSDDLGALLFATAAMKKIENALRAADEDPFAASATGGFTEKHDRIARAWRGVVRTEHPPGWDEPLAFSSYALLEELTPGYVSVVAPNGANLMYELRMKGMVDIAPLKFSFFWGGDYPEYKDSGRWAVRLTERGKEALKHSPMKAISEEKRGSELLKVTGGKRLVEQRLLLTESTPIQG